MRHKLHGPKVCVFAGEGGLCSVIRDPDSVCVNALEECCGF